MLKYWRELLIVILLITLCVLWKKKPQTITVTKTVVQEKVVYKDRNIDRVITITKDGLTTIVEKEVIKDKIITNTVEKEKEVTKYALNDWIISGGVNPINASEWYLSVDRRLIWGIYARGGWYFGKAGLGVSVLF